MERRKRKKKVCNKLQFMDSRITIVIMIMSNITNINYFITFLQNANIMITFTFINGE